MAIETVPGSSHRPSSTSAAPGRWCWSAEQPVW